MNCPACSRELPEDATFCGYCGSSLRSEETCARCGRSNPVDMRFCPGCGSSLLERAAPAEPSAPP
ncbi:MAG: zinc ribbon domain-containing protein, partial [Myxococcota bacterium]